MSTSTVGDDDAPAFFRKTKSNNFFAMDDSLDKIEPFEDANQEEEKLQTSAATKKPTEAAPPREEDDILKQVEKMML